MPFDLHWQDEAQTILRVDTHGEVTWGAWHALVDQLTAELAKAPHRIDLIFNDGSRMPPGNPMPHFKTTIQKFAQYLNLKLVVTVSNRSISNFVKALLNIVLRVSGIKWFATSEFVTTLDEALELIAQDRMKQEIAA
jgi:hypothetical protein